MCLRCKKVSERRGVELEDFNHAMLRLIYAFNLLFYSLFVFFVGFLLLPLAYLSLLFT